MAMIGKVRRMHHRQQKSVREIARMTSLSRNTVRKWLKAPAARGAEVPTRGRAQADGVSRGAQRSAQGRRAPAEKGAAHGAGAVRGDQGRRLRRRLHAGDRLHPGVAQCAGQVRIDERVRAAALRAGRGVPVRLERRRPGGRRHLLPAAGGAHEAVRQPRVLAGGLSEPGPRDAVRCPHAQRSRRWAAWPAAASTTT